MKVSYLPYQLKLSRAFVISYGARTHQPTLIVSISEGDYTGYGESTAISYYHVSLDEMIEKLKEIKPRIEAEKFDTPEKLWESLAPDLLATGHSFLLSAIDCASHDLFGKMQKTRIHESITPTNKSTPLSNYTISIGSTEEMIQQIKQKPWPVYKIKLGADTAPDALLEIRKCTEANLRIDANASWSLNKAVSWLPVLIDTGVELVEQPFAVDDLDELDTFRKICPIPIIADESCQTAADVAHCAKHFDGINIKLMKCGGLTPALRMIDHAKKLGLKVMAGCMTESSVGISAMTQLATQLDFIDADGAVLISNDPATGVCVEDGHINFSEGYGAGIDLSMEMKNQFAQ
jgi:L-alanine-DL-glutamate epimerase-like enolase superfamily enzyme